MSRKIYNEVIIDMNPESHSYMEVTHEDSFEYNGEMMFMQEDEIGSEIAEYTQISIKEGGKWHVYEWRIFAGGKGEWTPTGASTNDASQMDFTQAPSYDSLEEATKAQAPLAAAKKTEATSWGAGEITKDDFYNEDGSKKTVREIYEELNAKPGFKITGQKLVDAIQEALPKIGPVDQTKLKKDIYGISKDATAAATEKRKAEASGTGTSMRASIGGMKDVSTQVEGAVAGLKEDAIGDFETGAMDVFGAIDTADYTHSLDYDASWEEAKKGGKIQSYENGGKVDDLYSIFGNKSNYETVIPWELYPEDEQLSVILGGGKKPKMPWELYSEEDQLSAIFRKNDKNKDETFSNMLIQLPDAGGS